MTSWSSPFLPPRLFGFALVNADHLIEEAQGGCFVPLERIAPDD